MPTKTAGYYLTGLEYRYVDPERNSNKYYRMWTTTDRPEWGMVQWGRIGTRGQSKITTAADAQKRVDSKVWDGYEYYTTYSTTLGWSSDLENQDANTVADWLQEVVDEYDRPGTGWAAKVMSKVRGIFGGYRDPWIKVDDGWEFSVEDINGARPRGPYPDGEGPADYADYITGRVFHDPSYTDEGEWIWTVETTTEGGGYDEGAATSKEEAQRACESAMSELGGNMP